MTDTRDGLLFSGAFALVLAVGIAAATWWSWYVSGKQVEVYRREGVTISQWEVFIGCVPAERSINIKKPAGAEHD